MKQFLTKKNIFRTVVGISFLILYVGILFLVNRGWNGYTTTESTGVEYETAKVLSVLEDNSVSDASIEGRRRGSMELQVEIISGRYKGDTVSITNYLSAMYNVDVKAGQTISVRIDTVGENEYQVSVYNYDRTGYLIFFALLFAFALIVIGGWQGFRAFLGLIFTFVSIVYLLLPLTLKGWPAA